jgi:cytochrome b pre-mRNA-processing protein 3
MVTSAMLGFFRRRNPHERAGFALYTAAVRSARDPGFYTTLGVADTLDGRFDLVGLHVALLIRRLRDQPALAQAVFDAMFSDMDSTLREMGVADIGVGRRIKAMMEALHGRAEAYDAALAADDRAELATSLARNVWRNAPPGGSEPQALADWAVAQDASLAAQPTEALLQGQVGFAPAPVPA